MVDFVEMSYTVTEGQGSLYMYVQLVEGAIERAFPSTVEVEFTTLDLSTEGSYVFLECSTTTHIQKAVYILLSLQMLATLHCP